MSILASFFRRERERASPTPDTPPMVLPPVRQQRGGTVICFTGDSEGNALREHSRWSLAPFESLASRVVLIDWSDPRRDEQLLEALSGPVWFAASMFGLGQEISVTNGHESGNYWSVFGIPFVRMFGDLPAYFPDRHVAAFPNSINFYGDPVQTAFYNRWFSSPALAITAPPLVLDRIPTQSLDLSSKKTGRILFPKNGNSVDRLTRYWHESLPESVADALDAMAEESTQWARLNGRPRFDDLVVSYFAAIGLDVGANRPLLCFLVAQLDDYLRRFKSRMIAEALLDLPVIIRGRFWDHVDFSGKRAIYDPDSDAASTRELIDQAPAVIDMSPNTQDIPHDRVRRAIGRCTAFLTNRMACFDGVGMESKRFTFDFSPESIHDLVEQYVLRPSDAVELGMEQSRVFLARYRDECYAEALATVVDLCALRIGERPRGTQDFVVFPPASYG